MPNEAQIAQAITNQRFCNNVCGRMFKRRIPFLLVIMKQSFSTVTCANDHPLPRSAPHFHCQKISWMMQVAVPFVIEGEFTRKKRTTKNVPNSPEKKDQHLKLKFVMKFLFLPISFCIRPYFCEFSLFLVTSIFLFNATHPFFWYVEKCHHRLWHGLISVFNFDFEMHSLSSILSLILC